MIKKRKGLFFLVLVLVVGILVTKVPILPGEQKALQFLSKMPSGIYDFMYGFTRLGDPVMYFLIWFPLVLLVFTYDRQLAYQLIASLLISLLFHQGLKFLFQRPRPIQFMTIDQGGYSYPSGHATSAIASYYFYGRKQENKILQVLLPVIAVIIGVSRLFVGVHWPSDVIMGMMLGLAVTYFVEYLFERGEVHEN